MWTGNNVLSQLLYIQINSRRQLLYIQRNCTHRAALLLTEEFNTRVLAISGVSSWGKADVYEVFQKHISSLGFEKGRLVIEQRDIGVSTAF